MKYIVHGFRNEIISVEVEAESQEEALELASESDKYDIDTWDTDVTWTAVLPQH